MNGNGPSDARWCMLAPCLSSAAQWPQWPHSLTHDPSPSPRHFSSCASFADQSRKGTPREKTEAALVPPCLMNTENCLNSTIACSFNGNKVVDMYSASTRSVSKALGYSTHSRGITHAVLSVHNIAFHPQAEWAIPAFAFAAGTHLPTPEGWKAE